MNKKLVELFYKHFFLYIKMSTGYYWKTKKTFKKRAPERYQNLYEQKKNKSDDIVENAIKIFPKMKKKNASWV